MLVTGIVVIMVGMGVSFVNTTAVVCVLSATIASFIVRSTLINRVWVADEESKEMA